MVAPLSKFKERSEVGYTSYTGVELTAVGDGWAEGRILISDHHLNPSGAVHGGTIFCLGDVTGGVAYRSTGALPVTQSSSITYFRPFLNDRVIYSRADVIRAGKTTGFVEIKIYNEQKTECARISATYYNVEGRTRS